MSQLTILKLSFNLYLNIIIVIIVEVIAICIQ